MSVVCFVRCVGCFFGMFVNITIVFANNVACVSILCILLASKKGSVFFNFFIGACRS